MRRASWLVGLLWLGLAGHSLADTPASASESLQLQRKNFADDEKIDLEVLSKEIQSAIKDAIALDRTGDDAAALNRLLTLQKYAAIEQFPSYDVQQACAVFYAKLGRDSAAQACRQRAAAMADILQKHLGSGTTPDDPIRLITPHELGEWLRSQSANLSDIRTYPYQSANLQAVTYSSDEPGSSPKVAYFHFSSRLEASLNADADIFAPQPDNGEYVEDLKHAHEQRQQFLSDKSFNYQELIQLCTTSIDEAIRLDQKGNAKGALAKFREIEKIRPIVEIPIFDVIATYSYLLGKAGDTKTQQAMRMYIFGIEQDIAHSGDGSTQNSALHVVAVSEEYTWLRAKKLSSVRQGLALSGDEKYDVIEAIDANGHNRTIYFNITQVYSRESPFTMGQ